MRRLAIVLCALALLGAAHWYRQRPIGHVAGVLVAGEPLQTEPSSRATIRHGDFDLLPLADFDVEARVLSRHDYSFGTESVLSPTDFALGWGRMSDTAVIERLDVEQSARWYTYHWNGAPPIPLDEIVRSSANMHLIPGDAAVARGIAHVRVGEIVELRGRLVEARRSDGWHWVSSLRRDDTGAGACELVLVESVERR
ncbi:hypothetical protein [Dokdonella soli]|uniref:SH3 domain-containing protein n=1 Tax=Dokdonella soli TaxID=529810 RepID=A0ABN1IGY8_9GAMM